LPFQIDDAEVSEEVRLRYRYLDLHRSGMQARLQLRTTIVSGLRRFVDAHGFLDIEAPMLTKATRYHTPNRIIVYAWVNDESTKRAYESGNDAYRVFRRMLESGHPPDDWDQLLAEARSEMQRLKQAAAKLP
jgi:hypothetical protein